MKTALGVLALALAACTPFREQPEATDARADVRDVLDVRDAADVVDVTSVPDAPAVLDAPDAADAPPDAPDAADIFDAGSFEDAVIDLGPPPDAGPCAPHVPAFGTPCHTTSECDPARFEMCFAPGASTGCGICVMAHRTCLTDADCASTDFCESYVEPCARPFSCGNGSDVTSTRCAPRCSATSCGTDATCESDGRCHPVPCFGGAYSCPALTTCVTSPTSDAHGCSRDSCTTDADCGCGGACLTGFCYDTLGSCMPPAA